MNQKGAQAATDESISSSGKKNESPKTEGTKGSSSASAVRKVLNLPGIEYWEDESERAFASIEVARHVEHYPLSSRRFHKRLTQKYMEKYDIPTGKVIADAVQAMEALALRDQKVFPTAMRFGEHGGCLYLDLCDKDWNVIQISKNGWHLVSSADCPIRFIRASSMKSLPVPCRLESNEAALIDLRDLLNIGEQEWNFVILHVLATFKTTIPQPVLAVKGGQGTGKSLLIELLRKLIDPSVSELRSLPVDEKSLFVSLVNNPILAFDNVSNLSHLISDALCKIATGAGFASKQNYTDDQEIVLSGIRPVWLCGIGDFVSRADLAERSTQVDLPKIPDSNRLTREEILNWFKSHHAFLLAELCDIASETLRRLPETKIKNLPRMADFALFACAAAPSLGWTPDDFLSRYSKGKTKAQMDKVQNDILGSALLSMFNTMLPDTENPERKTWRGTASDLVQKLDSLAISDRHKRDLPKVNYIKREIQRLAPDLEKHRISFDEPERQGAGRYFSLSMDLVTVDDSQ